MGAESLAPTGIRSPDRPACSESLYRLSYPDPTQRGVTRKKKMGELISWTVRCMNCAYTIHFIHLFIYPFISLFIYFRVHLFNCCKWNLVPLASLHFYLHPVLKAVSPLPDWNFTLLNAQNHNNTCIYHTDKNKHVSSLRLGFSLLFRTRNFRNIAQNGSRL